MDTNEITTVTMYLAPEPPVAVGSFTGSHIILDHGWLFRLGGKDYGFCPMRGSDGCTLAVGNQMAAIPMTAPTCIAVTTSIVLLIGFVLVVGAKLFKQANLA